MSDQVYSLFKSRDGSQSPLDGDHFTQVLAKTLQNMGRSGPRLISPPQRFDLYLTQTDLHEWRRATCRSAACSIASRCTSRRTRTR